MHETADVVQLPLLAGYRTAWTMRLRVALSFELLRKASAVATYIAARKLVRQAVSRFLNYVSAACFRDPPQPKFR